MKRIAGSFAVVLLLAAGCGNGASYGRRDGDNPAGDGGDPTDGDAPSDGDEGPADDDAPNDGDEGVSDDDAAGDGDEGPADDDTAGDGDEGPADDDGTDGDAAGDDDVSMPGTLGGACLPSDACSSAVLICFSGTCRDRAVVDVDGDGWVDSAAGGTDCDDSAPLQHPGRAELCDNGLDDDCDGHEASCVLGDSDGDGWSDDDELAQCADTRAVYRADVNPGVFLEPCCPQALASLPDALERCDWDCDGAFAACASNDFDGDGFVAPADCDDENVAIRPGAAEHCGNDIDEDCDGNDLDCDTVLDADGDHVAPPFDCDDGNTTVSPFAIELCDGVDNDCDGVIDEETGGDACPADLPVDGSGVPRGACRFGSTECIHTLGAVAATCVAATLADEEVCDDVDNDCNGLTDEGCDDDDDDFCDSTMSVMGTPPICAHGDGDCDDGDESVRPDAVESCDDTDNDCDSLTDDGCDDDEDGYCDASFVVIGAPALCDLGNGDCNDEEPTVHPFATEVCDDLDNDCVAGVDAGCDNDNDNYCDDAIPVVGTPSTCTWGGGDCNDAVATIRPGASEICDDLDNNCGSGIDEGCDDDDDDYCDAAISLVGVPATCASGGGDCNDAVDTIRPGVGEVCDNLDNNCGGGVDEGCDNDNDNYCDAAMPLVGFVVTCTSGGGDCDDTVSAIRPGASEMCDGVDNNCVSGIDEGCGG